MMPGLCFVLKGAVGWLRVYYEVSRLLARQYEHERATNEGF